MAINVEQATHHSRKRMRDDEKIVNEHVVKLEARIDTFIGDSFNYDQPNAPMKFDLKDWEYPNPPRLVQPVINRLLDMYRKAGWEVELIRSRSADDKGYLEFKTSIHKLPAEVRDA